MPRPGQHRLGPVLQVVAAPVLELLGGVAVALEQGRQCRRPSMGVAMAASISRICSPRAVTSPAAAMTSARADAAGHLAHLLGKIADHRAFGAGDLALVRLLLPGDQAENGCLAGAVGTDQAGAGGRENLHGGVVEQHPGAVLLADVGQMDHGNSQEKRRMEPGRDLGRCRKGRNRAGKGGVHTPRSGRSHPCRDFCGEQAGG